MTSGTDWQRAARAVVAGSRWSLIEPDDALQIAREAAWLATLSWRPDGGRTLFNWCWQRARWALAEESRRQYRKPVPTIDGFRDPPHVDDLPEPGPTVAQVIDGVARDDRDRRICQLLAAGTQQATIAAAEGITFSAVSHRVRAMRTRYAA